MLNQRLYGEKVNLQNIIDKIRETKYGKEVLEEILANLNKSELETLNINDKMDLEKIDFSEKKKSEREEKAFSNAITFKSIKSSKPKVTKWRSAEQKVGQLENYMGNSVRDVSRMNVGYDIESITEQGEKRYIEVKMLNKENAEFTITNNEYTAAHQYGENYYLCLLLENKAIYIRNPLNKLVFTKRVRQWEWVCDQYYGTEISFDIE